MTQSWSGHYWLLGLISASAIGALIASSGNCTFAQITPDSTLGAESSVVTPITPLINQIDGGAVRGANLFHSFEQFSVPTNGEARFNNAPAIQNIISRVTGSSASNIDGLIRANVTANLFLINPNGIIFGSNASLNIGGSFVASTASSLNFADGAKFSATTPQSTPLLTVSIPIGLQFEKTVGSIRNQSQASPNGATNSFGFPVGLQVPQGKTLALVGGDVFLEGGNLTAMGGRIELGSFAGNSLVSLNLIEKGWSLEYEGVQNFQNIQITARTVDGSAIRSFIDASGEPSGDIQIQGRRLMLTSGSQIFNINKGSETGGNLTVNASESVELTGRRTELRTRADGDGDTGDLTINSRKLIVRDGAEVLTSTRNKGAGGQLTVNASEAVELIGTNDVFSGLVSATFAAGDAGKLTINTGRLLIQDGATVSTESSTNRVSGRETPATGRGGDLTVNASESVELLGNDRNGNPSALFSITQGTADAGNLKIATNNLIVRNGAEINVSSKGTGNAGNLELIARSIRLDNGGKLIATSVSGEGGNITLSNLGLLLLRGNSEISTDATSGSGNGGNINIDTDVLAAVEGSDITAKAVEGRGGNIRIATQGLFLSPDSEINASSERGIDGVVEINRPDIDPSAELVVLPAEIIDVSGLVASGCPAGGANIARGGSQFVVAGRGGLPPTPAEATRSDTTLADLGTPVQNAENLASAATSSNQTSSSPTTLVEATGWVIGSKGEVLLTANAPTATTQILWLTPTSCHS